MGAPLAARPCLLLHRGRREGTRDYTHATRLTHHMQRQVQHAQVRLLEDEGVVSVKPALGRRALRVKSNLADLLPTRTNKRRIDQVCKTKKGEAQHAHGQKTNKQANKRHGNNVRAYIRCCCCHPMQCPVSSHYSTPDNPLIPSYQRHHFTHLCPLTKQQPRPPSSPPSKKKREIEALSTKTNAHHAVNPSRVR